MDLRVGGSVACHLLSIWILLIRVLHLEFVQFLSDLLIIMAQSIKLLLVLADSVKQLRVGCLASEELLDDLLNVREASLCVDLLESLFDFGISSHFLLHLGFKESAPKLLRQEVFIHLELIRIFVVVCCLVPDLLLPCVALDASLEGSLLVI